MRVIGFMIFAILFAGCSAKYQQSVLVEGNTKLVRDKSVLILTPDNGFYESTEYVNSGNMTAMAIQESFARYTDSTKVVSNCKDLVCMKASEKSVYDYYVIPEILHWEDRATEWSGKPDKIKVKLTIYDGQTDSELASTILSGTSKWATFGGDHPQDLLPEPVNEYIDSLY